MSVFETLNSINVNEHTEKKNGLTYLSWAWAWAEVKKAYPNAFYTIYESQDGIPYFTDGSTCWVKTGVSIEGLEHIEYLPIMDFRNNSIKKEKVSSMDMNKAIQRSLTKACARHGLGLYIYAGEDLPEQEAEATSKQETKEQRQAKTVNQEATQAEFDPNEFCTDDELKIIQGIWAKKTDLPITSQNQFKEWPKVTKAAYAWFMRKMHENESEDNTVNTGVSQ